MYTKKQPLPGSVPKNQIPLHVSNEKFVHGAYLEQLALTIQDVAQNQSKILEAIADRLYDTWRLEGRIFLIGNGGSYAVAAESAADLGKRTRIDKMPFLQAGSIMDNVSALSAYANDIGYDNALWVLLLPLKLNSNDTLITVSGSGNSPNIIKAVKYTKTIPENKRPYVINISGQYANSKGGKITRLADINLVVTGKYLGSLNQFSIMAGFEDASGIIMHEQIEKLRERIQLVKKDIFDKK